MIPEVIWTDGASQDYLASDSNLAPPQALDALIELLRLFPDIGTRTSSDRRRIRRALVGTRRVYGLYYATSARRLIVLALIDLRQNPARIEEMLQSRGIETRSA